MKSHASLLLFRWLLGGVLLASAGTARAHRLSDSLLRLDPAASGWIATLDIPIRDLALVAPVDPDSDGQVTWGELKRALPSLSAELQQHLRFRADGTLLTRSEPELAVRDLAGEPCASLLFQLTAPSPAPSVITVEYSLLFDRDPSHRGLLRVAHEENIQTRVFSPTETVHEVAFHGTDAPRSPAAHAASFLREGVHHIWIGTDHVLFLLALLFPAVLSRQERVEPARADRFGEIAWRVLKLVSAFTLAHSITLICATLDLVQLPSRLVESVIAASVVVAALNNLVPVFRERSVSVAFGFGLIHGFGFASVLQDLELPRTALASSLLAFNVGVELGQLAIVACFLPVAYSLRRTRTYRQAVVPVGSGLILVTAAGWFAERAFAWDLPWI